MKGESKAIRSALSAYKRSRPINIVCLFWWGGTHQVVDFLI